jgi:transcriptional regulator with XRE-family HTH domain
MSQDLPSREVVAFTLDSTTTRGEFGRALELLRRQHARDGGHQKLSLRDIAERTQCGSHTTVGNYLNGKTLPTSEALDRLLRLFKATDEQRRVLEAARERLEDQGVEQPERAAQPQPAPAFVPQRPHRKLWLIAVVVTAVVLAAVISWVMWRPRGRAFPDLVIVSPSPSEQWINEGPGCRPQTQWSHRFAGVYRGGVYVQLTTSGRDAAKVHVALTWGRKQWQDSVEAMPGAVQRGRGGTLLGFDKTGTTDDDPPDANPVVVLQTSVPVCAVFGTALTTPPPAPLLYVATSGWKTVS